MERQTLQAIIAFLQQYGLLHGLLAGLVALIRGAYEKDGLGKAIFDAALCVVIASFVWAMPGFEKLAEESPNVGVIASIVIGIIGANLIITTVRDCFTAAIKQLNPLNWFRKK